MPRRSRQSKRRDRPTLDEFNAPYVGLERVEELFGSVMAAVEMFDWWEAVHPELTGTADLVRRMLTGWDWDHDDEDDPRLWGDYPDHAEAP
jgi:hypothetical protein